MGDVEIPLGLRTAIESGSCALFLGAGVGHYARDQEGRKGPTGAELAGELAEKFKLPIEEGFDLPGVAQVVEQRQGRKELEAFLSDRLSTLEPDEDLRWLLSLPWRAIYTTNYDRTIQRAHELADDPLQEPVFISVSAEVTQTNPRFQVPVFFLHGSLFGDNPSVVITEDDYTLFEARRRMLFGALKQSAVTTPILYVGYSNQDPNWKLIFSELRAEFRPKRLPESFRVAPSTPSIESEVLQGAGIRTLDLDLTGFRRALSAQLGVERLDPSKWEQIEDSIPSDLRPAFGQSPAGVARLLNSWSYANQEDFASQPNVAQYLKGDLPNWALVGQQIPFERDVEEPLFEELLEYATAPRTTQTTALVVGSAGYGITTLLMKIAARLVTEHAGRVLFLRRGAPLLQADVQFACSLFAEPVFFVIDNASVISKDLPSILQHLRQTQIPACFLLGERHNEWAVRRARLSPQRFEIGPLSDGEIDRLLTYLEGQGALGILEDLPPQLRITAIKEKHQKELLVAMREATEGKQFDAILESEYQGVAGSLARQLYATVCCFYRLRAMPRDVVLAEILGKNVVEMYEQTAAATEGVVVWDLIDAANEVYAARARHHVIAEVIWQRVVEATDRESITLAGLSALNLSYPLDARAFENMVRSDSAVESIASFDGKVSFFEEAARKDPLSPYVRQHYARMLRREGKPELALAEVDSALRMSENVMVLHHTRGLILSDLAKSTESLDIARRRFVQAEEAFRRALSIYPKNEYAFQSLSRLYFTWAKRVEGEESARYIARAEETISEGLRIVTEREFLWVVSAELQQWLGNNETALAHLETAVKASPGAIFSRLILGRTHRKNGKAEDALEVLQPVVQNHPEEFRACVEYARALHDLGKPPKECVAVLRLGSLYGYTDPRFIATLGGFLFIDGAFTEAEKEFAKGKAQRFSLAERQRVEFVPYESGERMILSGEVVHVGAGYAFISSPGKPQIFLPGSKFGDLLIVVGKKLRFELGFSARGPVALNPKEAVE